MIGQSVCIYENSRNGMQALEMRDLKRLDKIPRVDDEQAWHQTRFRRCRGSPGLEVTEDRISDFEFSLFRELLKRVHQKFSGQGIPDATSHET